MKDGIILLVEDEADCEVLTLRALRKNNIQNEVVVARDGAEALDYLYATGAYAGRDVTVQPSVVLLDLKLPKLDGLEVLKRVRADEKTRHLPVFILTTSKEAKDKEASYTLGANGYVSRVADATQFHKAVRQLKLHSFLLHESGCEP